MRPLTIRVSYDRHDSLYLSHKIALDPNDKQRTHFAKASGTARFAYNWGLAEWQRQYASCKLDASRQLEYKSLRRGGSIVVADRWYPSSKTCSACGYKMKELPLSIRDWSCLSCYVKHDRDVNAAINLRNIAVGSTVTACGEESSGSSRKTRVKLASVKQEHTGRTTGLA